jgi:hypothetical protein
MRFRVVQGCLGLLLMLAGSAWAEGPGLDDPIWEDEDFGYTLHSELQAVNSNGVRTYPTTGFPLKLRGVLLNNPEDMLSSVPFSPNPVPFDLGAMWQVFVQSVDEADFGGTAVFMGQHYGNVPPWLEGITPTPEFSYTNAEWNAEMARVNFDRTTGHQFRAGDLVEIRAQGALYFGGKTNVNEEHFLADTLDFELVLLEAGYGIPEAKTLRLADIWDESLNRVYFDPMRASGGEHFQGTQVELLELTAANDASIWAPDELVTVQDADGRQFKLHLGLNVDLEKPTGLFNVSGIFNQEGGGPMGPGTFGYELWIMDSSNFSPLVYGDLDGDGFVGQDDLNEVLAQWGEEVGLGYRADYNSDGFIGQDDLNVVLAAWGSGSLPTFATVPEPSTWALCVIAVMVLWPGRRRGVSAR